MRCLWTNGMPPHPLLRDLLRIFFFFLFPPGIKIFWLDASEPEGFGPLSTNATWSAGSMRDMGSLFTLYWTQVFYDGLKSHGEEDIVMLPRAGWVATWRHGAVLWSGDIGSTMPVLKSQMNIGISAQISGIPWWAWPMHDSSHDSSYAIGARRTRSPH